MRSPGSTPGMEKDLFLTLIPPALATVRSKMDRPGTPTMRPSDLMVRARRSPMRISSDADKRSMVACSCTPRSVKILMRTYCSLMVCGCRLPIILSVTQTRQNTASASASGSILGACAANWAGWMGAHLTAAAGRQSIGARSQGARIRRVGFIRMLWLEWNRGGRLEFFNGKLLGRGHDTRHLSRIQSATRGGVHDKFVR